MDSEYINEFVMVSLVNFSLYCKKELSNKTYEQESLTLYLILRDIFRRKEITNLKLYSSDEYSTIISGVTIKTGRNILMVPISFDDEVDLSQLKMLSVRCEEEDKDLMLCVYTAESIM